MFFLASAVFARGEFFAAVMLLAEAGLRRLFEDELYLKHLVKNYLKSI